MKMLSKKLIQMSQYVVIENSSLLKLHKSLLIFYKYTKYSLVILLLYHLTFNVYLFIIFMVGIVQYIFDPDTINHIFSPIFEFLRSHKIGDYIEDYLHYMPRRFGGNSHLFIAFLINLVVYICLFIYFNLIVRVVSYIRARREK